MEATAVGRIRDGHHRMKASTSIVVDPVISTVCKYSTVITYSVLDSQVMGTPRSTEHNRTPASNGEEVAAPSEYSFSGCGPGKLPATLEALCWLIREADNKGGDRFLSDATKRERRNGG